jgi:hypothetical protein
MRIRRKSEPARSLSRHIRIKADIMSKSAQFAGEIQYMEPPRRCNRDSQACGRFLRVSAQVGPNKMIRSRSIRSSSTRGLNSVLGRK